MTHKGSAVLIVWVVACVSVASGSSAGKAAVVWLGWLVGAAAAGALLRWVLVDFAAGAVLRREKPFVFGDEVALGNISGRVVRIGCMRTAILTRHGVSRVRNSELVESAVRHVRSASQSEKLKLTLVIRIRTEPEAVTRILLRVAAANEAVLQRPAPVVACEAIGTEVLRFALVVAIAPSRRPILQVGNELASDIGSELAKAGIDAVVHFQSRSALPI